jgi:catechol 2,3-dioxygenase-like lactoylglutathione lyase family enzyme
VAAITGVHTVLLEVSDVDRSLAFWRDGLGIPLTPDAEDKKNCFDAWVGGTHLLLHRDFSRGVQGKPRAVGVHLHLSVDDADAFHALLLRRGIQLASAPEDKPWGPSSTWSIPAVTGSRSCSPRSAGSSSRQRFSENHANDRSRAS